MTTTPDMRTPSFSQAPLFILIAFAILGFSFAGCVPQHNISAAPELPKASRPADDTAGQIWQHFAARAATAEVMSGPFRINANLRYTDASGTTRVSSHLWGNGQKNSPYPLRLDLVAGVGSVVAKVREDAKSFRVYVPDEKTAYEHEGSPLTLSSFGVPVPLSLSDLTMILTGRSGLLFIGVPDKDAPIPAVRKQTKDGAEFSIPNAPLAGVLEISEAGVPIRWSESGGNGWTMLFEPGQSNPLFPEKIRISHTQGHSALIVLKEISRVSPAYPAAKLALDLPPGTTRRPLE